MNLYTGQSARRGSLLSELAKAASLLALPCRPNIPKGNVKLGATTFTLVDDDTVSLPLANWIVSQHSGARSVLVVARRITAEARAVFRSANVGFFDARGHLRVTGKGLFVDVDIDLKSPLENGPTILTTKAKRPLAGIGFDIALWLLARNEPATPGVREIGRAIGKNASTVSLALRRLIEAGLITDRYEPLLPEVFELCAQEWSQRQRTVTFVGIANEQLGATLAQRLSEPKSGWVLAGASADRLWDAPWFEARRAQPPSKVPTGELTVMVTKTTDLSPVRSQLRRPDPTATDQSTTFTLNVQYAPANWLVTVPSLLNSTERLGQYWSKWLSKPVATLPAIGVAMDLASTTARGREVLVAWNPPGVHRVW